MPKHGEKVLAIPVSPEAANDLQSVMERTGLDKTDVLRYGITAALRALADCPRVFLPIEFQVAGDDDSGKQGAQ